MSILGTKEAGARTAVCTPAFISNGWCLVAPVAVFVTVRESFAEVALVKSPVSQTRAIVSGGSLETKFITIVEPITTAPVLAAFLNAVIVTSVQRRLTKLKSATEVAVAIPDAATSIAIVLIVTAALVVAILALILVPAAIASVVPVYENISRLAAPSTVVLSESRQRQQSYQSQHAQSHQEFLSHVIHFVLPSIYNSPIAHPVSGRAVTAVCSTTLMPMAKMDQKFPKSALFNRAAV